MWMVSCLVIIYSTAQLCISFAPLLKAYKKLWVGEMSLSSVTSEEPARNSLCYLVKLAKKTPRLSLGKRAGKEENQVC